MPYISHLWSTPLPDNISGLKYIGEPQKLKARFPLVIPFFAKLKSQTLIWPVSSRIIFSGFKSR